MGMNGGVMDLQRTTILRIPSFVHPLKSVQTIIIGIFIKKENQEQKTQETESEPFYFILKRMREKTVFANVTKTLYWIILINGIISKAYHRSLI